VVQNMHNGMHRSGFWIVGSVYQGSDTGVHHGSGAHGTGLNGHEKIAVLQTMIAEGGSSFSQGDDFCMSSWVGVGHIAIESASDDFAVMNYDCAYRHFSYVERSLGGMQGLLHPQFVGSGASAVSHEEHCMRIVETAAWPQACLSQVIDAYVRFDRLVPGEPVLLFKLAQSLGSISEFRT